MLWKSCRTFPPLVWLMVIGVFFSKGTFYMVWPFMAVFLYQKFQLNEWQVGLAMTTAALTAVGVGFYAGALTDRLGRKTMLLSAGFTAVVAFSLLAIAEHLLTFCASMLLAAVSKDMWEPPSKAIISDMLPEANQREAAFQIRYFAVNVGAAIFPIIGVWVGLTAEQSTFFATSLVYLVLIALIYKMFASHNNSTVCPQPKSISFAQTLRVLVKDQLFLILVVANTLVAFIFAHMDSSLVQYLTRSSQTDVIELISLLIFTNAMTIVCLQFSLVRLLQNRSLNQRVYVGTTLLIFSQLGFALNPVDCYPGWIMAVFVLSLGEAILFPTMSIQVDQIAPVHMRGVYYGASALYSIGFAVAPYIGGLLLQQWDGSVLFLTTAALGLCVFALYYLTQFAQRPAFEQANTQD